MRSLPPRTFATTYVQDAVESKLFGLGVEAYTVGSGEFALAYALTRGKLVCTDAGHFHPTEQISREDLRHHAVHARDAAARFPRHALGL